MSEKSNAATTQKKVNRSDFHAVFAVGNNLLDELSATVSSHSVRFFGEGSATYAKSMGLPEEAPKKRAFVSLKSAIGAIRREFRRKYNSVTTKDKRDAEGNPMPKKAGGVRIVRCEPALTEFANLDQWNLTSESDSTRAYGTQGAVIKVLTRHIFLHCLQNQENRQTWHADEILIKLFGEERFRHKGLNPKAMMFIHLQSLLSASKTEPEKFPALVVSMKKGTLNPELTAEIIRKCSAESEDELGGALFKIAALKDELNLMPNQLALSIEYRDLARELRPGQGVTALWEKSVTEIEAAYKKRGADMHKLAESYGFSIIKEYPPPLVANKKDKSAGKKLTAKQRADNLKKGINTMTRKPSVNSKKATPASKANATARKAAKQ